MPRLHLFVRGRVQGVYYRASALELARKLGLVGWIRNAGFDAVEIVAEGGLKQLDTLKSWSRKGPPGASVRGIETLDEAETGEFDAFDVRRDA